MFSLVQFENTLWGYQMAWYLILLSRAVAVVLMDRSTLTWLALFGAIAAGEVGSFSSFQGCSYGQQAWCSSITGVGVCPSLLRGSPRVLRQWSSTSVI